MDFLRTSVSCWREGFTFKFCCTRALAGGEPSCWDGHSFTYERCCRPPLPSEASAVFEDVNCHRVPGHTDWQRLREELVVLSNSLEGGRFGEDFGQEGGRGLLRRLSRSFPRSLDCGVGRLALAVAQALLCILSGGDGCQKYWDHLAQAFRGDALDVVRMSATEWPVMELLLHLSRVAAALRQLYSEACQEVEGALDWPLLFQSAQDPNNAELAHKVLRMSFGDAAGAGALLGSGCRGGAQWLALNKLSFCMDMAPECVKSYTLVLQVFARRAASDGRALQSWMEEAGTWRLYDLHQGMVQNRVRHRFQLGLSRLELQHLGVLSPKAVVGCLRLKAAFSEASDELAYFLLDPEPGLTPFAAERCRALCGQTGRQWRSYGVLPEVTEGAMRGFPCACSAIDGAAGNCTPKEAPLFAMPRRSLGPPETAERSEVLGQAARVLDSLDGAVPVFVTMVFGKMSKYIPAFAQRVRSLGIPNVVVFVLDEAAEWACRREDSVRCVRGEPKTALQKYVIVLTLASLGCDTFWFDFDSVWLKNPVPALKRAEAAEAARAVQEKRAEALLLSAIDFDSKNCAMNAFFLLRPSRGRAVAWLLSLLDWIYKRPYVHDQLAYSLFLGATPLVDEEPLPQPPVWAPLDPNIFANAARFEGLGFSSEVEDLVLFHFFDGWNSNSPEGVEQWATATYRGVDLFAALYGSAATAREAMARSRLPAPEKLKDCSQMSDFGLGVSITSNYMEVPT